MFSFLTSVVVPTEVKASTWWELQAIDTVKDSRDRARERATDERFLSTIDMQVKLISETGATHLAIGTPYDEEFYPFMKKWVDSARRHNLKLWFRGNFSGWENWFDYATITEAEHKQKLSKFLDDNHDLFEEGDIFTPCAECENGAIGDPRNTGRVDEYRQFLIDEYKIAKEKLRITGNDVASNYFPMNGDVARLIMDKETTRALGGIVVIDHYVRSPAQLAEDVRYIAERSGGKIVLGEIGAPIPDIHGDYTDDQQAQWLKESLLELAKIESVIGVNYWTGFNSTTQIWNNSGDPGKSVRVLKDFFSPKIVTGSIVNEIDKPIKNAQILTEEKKVFTDSNGNFRVPVLPYHNRIDVTAAGYQPRAYLIVDESPTNTLILKKDKEDLIFRIIKFLRSIFAN